jgi:hypothetical protein
MNGSQWIPIKTPAGKIMFCISVLIKEPMREGKEKPPKRSELMYDSSWYLLIHPE